MESEFTKDTKPMTKAFSYVMEAVKDSKFVKVIKDSTAHERLAGTVVNYTVREGHSKYTPLDLVAETIVNEHLKSGKSIGLCTRAKICGLNEFVKMLKNAVGKLKPSPAQSEQLDHFAQRITPRLNPDDLAIVGRRLQREELIRGFVNEDM